MVIGRPNQSSRVQPLMVSNARFAVSIVPARSVVTTTSEAVSNRLRYRLSESCSAASVRRRSSATPASVTAVAPMTTRNCWRSRMPDGLFGCENGPRPVSALTVDRMATSRLAPAAPLAPKRSPAQMSSGNGT